MKTKRPRLHCLRPRVQAAPDRLRTLAPGSWRSGKTTAERGYGYAWQKAREVFLRLHPLCECPDCDGGRKRVTAAEVVDHRVAHRGDARLFWDRSNWQAMAKRCHDKKTASEEQGGSLT